MIVEHIPALQSLGPDEKILLAAELWRDVVGAEGESPSPALVAALRERLHHYREHPYDVSSWEEVRARIIADQPS